MDPLVRISSEFPLTRPETGASHSKLGADVWRIDFQRRRRRLVQGLARMGRRAKPRALGSMACATSFSPYVNFSYVSEPNDRSGDHPTVRSRATYDQAQSDRLSRNSPPSIRSITGRSRAIGVRNRLQTRRDDLTVSWLELETYFDVNFDDPFDQHAITPTSLTSLPSRRCLGRRWRSIRSSRCFDKGFTEVNTSIQFQAHGQHPVSRSVIAICKEIRSFVDSSLFTVGRLLSHRRQLGLRLPRTIRGRHQHP